MSASKQSKAAAEGMDEDEKKMRLTKMAVRDGFSVLAECMEGLDLCVCMFCFEGTCMVGEKSVRVPPTLQDHDLAESLFASVWVCLVVCAMLAVLESSERAGELDNPDNVMFKRLGNQADIFQQNGG